MMDNKKNKKLIQDKLATVKYSCSNKTHLVVNQKKCLKCKEKTCTFICPANVYSVDEVTKETLVQYENCLECGACRIACPYGTIEWEYPESGCGVVYKHS